MAHGLSSGDIVTRLHLSPITVDFDRREIRDTLGIKSTALLVRWLIPKGLLEPYP
jgi:DNA-binding CsgD family transcriptional regulator